MTNGVLQMIASASCDLERPLGAGIEPESTDGPFGAADGRWPWIHHESPEYRWDSLG